MTCSEDVIDVGHLHYADNMQLYTISRSKALLRGTRLPQLKVDKTEVIYFGSLSSSHRIAGLDLMHSVGSETFYPASVVRDHGGVLDSA